MPERTCVGCRTVRPKSSLVRLAEKDGALVPDLKGRMAGRGVYICPDGKCLQEAYRKNPFSRSLKKNVALPEFDGFIEKIKGGSDMI